MTEDRKTIADTWAEIAASLERRLGLARTFRWLPVIGVEREGQGKLTLRAQNPRAATLARKYLKPLKEAVAEAGFQVHIEFIAGPLEAIKTVREPKAALTRQAPDAPVKATLSLEHSLDRFHPEPNELALRFACEVASRPGSFSPLFIQGGPGLGKTHLLKGIVLRFRQLFPDRQARYLSADSLGRFYSAAAYKGEMLDFHRSTRALDLLALDDLQGLATKTGTRAELLHLLDALDARGAQVVVSAPGPVRAIPGLEDALRTRLVSGVGVELKRPEAPQVQALLRRVNRRFKQALDESVLGHIAERFPGCVREAIQAATKIYAYRQLTGALVDLDTARRVLDEMIGAEEQRASPENIARSVGEVFQVSSEAILSGGRKASVARARQIAMALTRRLTDLTLAEIGEAFGGRSTGAVHFALRRVREYCAQDPALRAATEELAARFPT